ncbi:MAG: hypothetical protein B6241_02440 [Spirochaetaceae bacterium 4572_59]|nr:MAG: hypothetical protein B6241_02440 [Spirochaetaceae bacterium 4572_59]
MNYLFPLLSLAFLAMSCSLKENMTMEMELDLSPPCFIRMEESEGQAVYLFFNESLQLENEKTELDSGDDVLLTIKDENCLVLTPEVNLTPGRQYIVSLSVKDLRGNSNNFMIRFWGWNPARPAALINEFNPQGSGNNTDTVELYFIQGGDTAGLTLYYGTKYHYEYRYFLPSLLVEEGDYLLIHCRPQSLEEEINESDRKDVSGGLLASDNAWDLWLPEDSGLSGSNGILSLYASPMGVIQDGVIYSDREADPEDELLGWTSRTFDAAADLYEIGSWEFSSEDISPEEAVPSGYTTGTRTLSRSSSSEDTDSAADWHTTPTGGKTFGYENTNDIYIPPNKD